MALTLVGLITLAAAPNAHAQSEDQIKAAFLFNFARYVEWPADALSESDASIRICMIGSESFASVVSKIVSGKKVSERSVEVTTTTDLSAADQCHILYVGTDAGITAADVASSVAGRSVFTVADQPNFATKGGIANFIRTDNKVRFEINPDTAKAAGLKVSSRLLRLAKVVK